VGCLCGIKVMGGERVKWMISIILLSVLLFVSGCNNDNYFSTTIINLNNSNSSTNVTPSNITTHWNSTGNNTYLSSTGNNVGIGTNIPTQKLEVKGAFGLPQTSGTTQNGILRISQTSGSAVLDIGQYGGAGSWLQSTRSNDLSIYDEILINPRGGNVGIGTLTPKNKLDVAGGMTIGSSYAGTDTSPTNGLIIEGKVGIQENNPDALLHIKTDDRWGNKGIHIENTYSTNANTYLQAIEVGAPWVFFGNNMYVSGGNFLRTSSNFTGWGFVLDSRPAYDLFKLSYDQGSGAESKFAVTGDGDVLFSSNLGANPVASASDMFFDADNIRLGIGTYTPRRELEVIGDINVSGDIAYGSLTANSPILMWTKDDFTTEIKKATNGNYYIEYVDGNLKTQREWINCTSTTWYQVESCKKLEQKKYYENNKNKKVEYIKTIEGGSGLENIIYKNVTMVRNLKYSDVDYNDKTNKIELNNKLSFKQVKE